MVNLSQDQLKDLVDTVKVGQVWKSLEDNRIVMISMVKPKEIQGYMWDRFQVVPYISFTPLEFVRYFKLVLNPRRT